MGSIAVSCANTNSTSSLISASYAFPIVSIANVTSNPITGSKKGSSLFLPLRTFISSNAFPLGQIPPPPYLTLISSMSTSGRFRFKFSSFGMRRCSKGRSCAP